jgi:hypothetical protein
MDRDTVGGGYSRHHRGLRRSLTTGLFWSEVTGWQEDPGDPNDPGEPEGRIVSPQGSRTSADLAPVTTGG